MFSHLRKASMGLLVAVTLTGCGGGGGDGTVGNGGGGGGGSGSPAYSGSGSNSGSGSGSSSGSSGGSSGSSSASGISYLPLNTLLGSKDFSGFDEDDKFRIGAESPSMFSYLINPINAATLAPITTAVTSDYTVTIDDIQIDNTESYPILQKVLGDKVVLATALVFDVSASVTQVDMVALINEAKAYVNACKLSSDETIANQYFVVWAFGRDVVEVTNGFTQSQTTINAALDSVRNHFNSKDLLDDSNLHRAVVEAIGRFEGEENGSTYSFRDSENPGENNDLNDYPSPDGILMTQMVMFSSGPDTALEFSQDRMKDALKSQAYVKFNPSATPSSGATVNYYKPVFYYVMGSTTAGSTYAALSSSAEATESLLLANGTYQFKDSLIAKQQAAITKRIDLDQIYLYRYAYRPRQGDHTAVFAPTNASGFTYSLTGDIKEDYVTTYFGNVAPKVEITGPNNEYLSNRTLAVTTTVTVKPATRWSPDTFDASNYAWTVTSGDIDGTVNADGTYTITSVNISPSTLHLQNQALTSGTTTFDLTVTN